METLIKKIEVLEDGKLKLTLTDNSLDWLQPVIVVDSYPSNENFEVYGSKNREYRTDVSAIKEIDGVSFVGAYDDLETALRNVALKANGLLNGGSSGGGGAGGSTEAKQEERIQQETPKEERFYFNLSDVEQSANEPVFPLTCQISFQRLNPFGSENVPPATYANIDDLITTANTLTFWKLEKRTETSFYVLDGVEKVSNLNQNVITLNDGLTFRVYRFYRLNKGSYPSTNLSVNDLILEEAKYASGTGLNSDLTVVNPIALTFYAVKSISIIVLAAVDGEVNIKSLDDIFSSGQNLPITAPKGQYITKYERKFDRPAKNPIVIDNTGGDPLNSVLINVTY